jgi:hypothetical protein
VRRGTGIGNAEVKRTTLRNHVTFLVRLDKERQSKWTLKSFKGKPKKNYGYMRRLHTVKDEVTQLVMPGGELTQNDLEVAETHCNCFNEVFVWDAGNGAGYQWLSDKDGGDNGRMVVNFDKEAVRSKLSRLKPDKSPGLDNMHPMVMKECADALAVPLSRIF